MKYRVEIEGGFVEYPNLESIPEGAIYIEMPDEIIPDPHELMRAAALISLDETYTAAIDKLVAKHVQANIMDGTIIPEDIITERNRLKQEYQVKKQEIIEMDFSEE